MSSKKPKAEILKGHDQLVTSVSFDASDGNLLASASADCTVKIWDITNNMVIETLECEKRVATCSFSKDGRQIVSGDWSYLTKLWDAMKRKLIVNLQGHEGKVTSASFRHDCTVILTGSEDKSARMWDTRRKQATEFIAPDEVLDCCFSPDGNMIVAACKNSELLSWDVRRPSAILSAFKGHEDWVTCCEISTDGKSMLSGSTDKTLKLWNVEQGSVIRTFEGHTEAVNDCHFCGQWIVSCAGNRFWGSKDNRALMWDPETGRIRKQLNAHTDAVMGLDAHRPTARFATASMDKSIRLWDAVVPEKEKRERDDAAAGARKFECKLGCGKSLIRTLLDEHESKECPNRPKDCMYCSEHYPAKDLRAHEESCPMRTYICACDVEVKLSEQERHDAEECGHRTVACGLGCGMMVKFAGLEMHEQTVCQERMVTCKQGCGRRVVAKELLEHMGQECRAREVQCGACGLRFSAKDEKTHRRKLCAMRVTECALGCGERVAAKDAQAHTRLSCPLRPLPCGLGCGATMAARDLAEHEREGCPKLVACSSGCGARVSQARQQEHAAACPYNPSFGHRGSLHKRSSRRLMPDPDAEHEPGPSPDSNLNSKLPVAALHDAPVQAPASGLPRIELKGDAGGGSWRVRKPPSLFPGIDGPAALAELPRCGSCGAAERACGNAGCGRAFCPGCLHRLGLPRSKPPLCGPCARSAAGKFRDHVRATAPSPMAFRF